MSQGIVIGQYIPGKSFIHRLDPRLKVSATVLFLITVFLANNWLSYAVLLAFTILAIFLSEVSLRFFANGLKPLLLLIILTVFLQIFFTQGEILLFNWGPIQIYQESLINAAFIFLRFMLIIFMSTLLTLTTMPLEITDAIEYLLRPLTRIKVPVYAIALMLSIALRFVPTLMEEVQKIMNAQRARGMDFSEGTFIQRLKNVVPLLIPLFVSAFNRADDLAIAMESRGYQGGDHRTKYRQLNWMKQDTFVLFIYLLLGGLILYLRS